MTTVTHPSDIESASEFATQYASDSNDVLNRNVFLVKEHVGLFKASSNYDVYDPDTGEVILECREPNLGMFTKLVRFTDYKRMTPFEVHITTPGGQPVLQVSRGISLLLSHVQVQDAERTFIGTTSDTRNLIDF